MRHIFLFKRFFLLGRRQVLSHATAWLTAFGAVGGTLLVLALLIGYFEPANIASLRGLFFTGLFIGGYIFSSTIFNELHHPQRSSQYLTLPVSVTERVLVSWLITGILFPVVMFLTAMIVNLIVEITLNLTPFPGLFSQGSRATVSVYIVTQSIFLFGAAYFKKNHFLKTILSLFVLFIVFNSIIGLVGWALLSPFSSAGELGIDMQNVSPGLEPVFMDYIPTTAHILFNYLMLPFFLVVTWFSLKERQV